MVGWHRVAASIPPCRGILGIHAKFMLWQTWAKLVQGVEATPLHIAVIYTHVDAVKVLLQHNADVNAIDDLLVRIQPQLWHLFKQVWFDLRLQSPCAECKEKK